MLFFVGTGFHAYTLDALIKSGCGGHGTSIIPVRYDDLFTGDPLPGGTYLFTDIERLSGHERLLASACYRSMAAQPNVFRPINDPARARFRYGLLRALHKERLNDFDAYRANGLPRPRRFPVFIKSETNHEPAVTDLLADQAALDAALAQLRADGQPLDDLAVIEFEAEPVKPGVWNRYTAFRIGDDILEDQLVSEAHWMVKSGEIGLTNDDEYARDEVRIRTNPHSAILKRAFDIGGIAYGRADFGLVGGGPAIYEINTNPNIPYVEPLHPSAVRQRTRQFVWDRLTTRFATLAAEFAGNGETAMLDHPIIRQFRERNGGARLTWRP